MITEVDFAAINDEVKKGLNDVLAHIMKNSPDNYVLLLADGEYKQEYENYAGNFNPFVIDNRTDKYLDETRLNFLVQFLQQFYTFPGHAPVDDSEIRMNMEMMIYSHVWESKPFLKKLYRLARLSAGLSYDWNVEVPAMGKHDFIRNEIRDVFKGNGHYIETVITNGFHTSLRNAFAHSEYSFDMKNKVIHLDNYQGNKWELKNITFDEWSRRFVYSVLLNYQFLDLIHTHRTTIIEDLGTDTFAIDHPSKSGKINNVNIVYRKEHDSFNFAK